MGIPRNYSLELPQRCLKLIEELWPCANKIYLPHQENMGPLTSTFLLSLAMPIINLPIERIERVARAHEYYVNDRHIDGASAQAITDVLQKTNLAQTPFFKDGAWSFHTLRETPFQNVADGLPDTVLDALESDAEKSYAAKMPTAQWSSVLRNALSHGGIAYLDEDGRNSMVSPARMYAFVSGKYDEASEADEKPLVAVHFLRIGEDDLLEFVRLWVHWLVDSGAANILVAAA
jgi:hypothetical protein